MPAAKDIFYSGPFNDFNEDDGFLEGPVSSCLCFVLYAVSNELDTGADMDFDGQ